MAKRKGNKNKQMEKLASRVPGRKFETQQYAMNSLVAKNLGSRIGRAIASNDHSRVARNLSEAQFRTVWNKDMVESAALGHDLSKGR